MAAPRTACSSSAGFHGPPAILPRCFTRRPVQVRDFLLTFNNNQHKAIRAACAGCHDLQASTKSDIIDGILKTSSAKDDDEEDEADGDWMDE